MAACFLFLQRLLESGATGQQQGKSRRESALLSPQISFPIISNPHYPSEDPLVTTMLPFERQYTLPSTASRALVLSDMMRSDTEEHTAPPPRIAIIIDDIGNQWLAGRRSVELTGDITLAVLPFSPHALALAQLAQRRGKELMLHAPMEPETHHAWHQGLDTLMDEHAIRTQLTLMLDSLPMVKGVNNHMGSALTQRDQSMTWIMEELAQRNLYFIDSRTSAHSRALEQARRLALASAKRDVFLDNVRSLDAINRQFNTLLHLARTRGSAIAIGHPYPETLLFLEKVLPDLPATGVQLMPVSQLLRHMSPPHQDVHTNALPLNPLSEQSLVTKRL